MLSCFATNRRNFWSRLACLSVAYLFNGYGAENLGGKKINYSEDDASNMKLSHDRAKAVRDYLVAGGVAPARLQSKGYGESNPIATNDTDDGRKANRRTEFVILEF